MQSELIDISSPIVILGEAGMGKTHLLRWLGSQPGRAYCTARQLRNVRPNANALLGSATTIVVDALDELSVRQEGEAVDEVLQRLGDTGYPNFVLSCRVSDWRHATSVSAIREQYASVDLRVFHLEPLTSAETLALLASRLGDDVARARSVADHFEARNLGALLGNPQTVDMIARVAEASPLPDSVGSLFDKAVDVLRKEHRDERAHAQLDKESVLDAAGAAFATLILTGCEALSVDRAEPPDGELAVTEIAAFPNAAELRAVLGTRLFCGGTNRFTYAHRRIGEYLGSRWLARQADTVMKRRRILAMFHAHGVVPASLRGMHAWLAHHDKQLASEVIKADPMGVVEYGDADELSPVEGHALLESLDHASKRDPHFRDWWHTYSLRGAVQPGLVGDIRKLIFDRGASYSLRHLLVEAAEGSAVADDLRSSLIELLLNASEEHSLRSAALRACGPMTDSEAEAMLGRLRGEASDDSTQLALELLIRSGFHILDDRKLVALIVKAAQTTRLSHLLGRIVEQVLDLLPNPRVESVLDELVSQVSKLGDRYDRVGNDELTDFGYELIERRLRMGATAPARLWHWIGPFDGETGYRRDQRQVVRDLIRSDDKLRRGVQRFVYIEDESDLVPRQRFVKLTMGNGAFALTCDDVANLLESLVGQKPEEQLWREILTNCVHGPEAGRAAREVAKRLVANRPDMHAWIDSLATPEVPEWKIRQQRSAARQTAEREMRWREDRGATTRHIDKLRAGDLALVLPASRIYLDARMDGVDEAATPSQRVAAWLGDELALVAFAGFDATLFSDAEPTAKQMAESEAESRRWNMMFPRAAAILERVRTGIGVSDVPSDRLISSYYSFKFIGVGRKLDVDATIDAIEKELHKRALTESATRMWIEAHLERGIKHIARVDTLMREADPTGLAASLAAEWLAKYPNMDVDPEAEMIDRLVVSSRLSELQVLVACRLEQSLSQERRANWDAVALFVDFDRHRARLIDLAKATPTWFWTLRRRFAGGRSRPVAGSLSAAQLGWIFATFRVANPQASHPSGISHGDENPWDASDFLEAVAVRLAEQTSSEARAELRSLVSADRDGYTDFLTAMSMEQLRKSVEQQYVGYSLAALRALVEEGPPATVVDLQATLLVLLERVQKRVTSDPADPWRGFFSDQGVPYDEERCRDHLLTMLGDQPESIELMPEGHLARDNRADIIASLPGMRLPIEIKGQWHDKVWTAADNQLDRLYTSDYKADRRGIYLVLWFGREVPRSKAPRARARGRRRPTSASLLSDQLAETSAAVQDGRIAVVVLNLEQGPLAQS